MTDPKTMAPARLAELRRLLAGGGWAQWISELLADRDHLALELEGRTAEREQLLTQVNALRAELAEESTKCMAAYADELAVYAKDLEDAKAERDESRLSLCRKTGTAEWLSWNDGGMTGPVPCAEPGIEADEPTPGPCRGCGSAEDCELWCPLEDGGPGGEG